MKDHCPRCLSSWEKSDFNDARYNIAEYNVCVSRCGMLCYLNFAKTSVTFLCENIIAYQDLLVWFSNKKYCQYTRNDECEPIKLPYLKFDIEADKLKLYLTFS